MSPQQQVEHLTFMYSIMAIAHGMSRGENTEAELLQELERLQKWIDHQINLEVTAAVKPYLKFEVVRGGKG